MLEKFGKIYNSNFHKPFNKSQQLYKQYKILQYNIRLNFLVKKGINISKNSSVEIFANKFVEKFRASQHFSSFWKSVVHQMYALHFFQIIVMIFALKICKKNTSKDYQAFAL